MAKQTYREVLSRASSFLEAKGKEGYGIQFLFLERKNWTKTQWVLNMNQEISEADQQQIQADIAALLENIPPHYLLGYADFYDHRFKVTEATLIPRPETEELVALCLQETSKNLPLHVVDVGTGDRRNCVKSKSETAPVASRCCGYFSRSTRGSQRKRGTACDCSYVYFR
jgi:release factor glutamine methyltransferase